MTAMSKHASKKTRLWLLFPIAVAVPAAVEVWASWVGLGSLCGFPVADIFGWKFGTGWTLAIGMEAYGAFAMYVWLGAACGKRSQVFALCSSMGAFGLSFIGQIAYHLMHADHVVNPPVIVVVFVACLPVAVLAFAAALIHLMHADTATAVADEVSLRSVLDAAIAGRQQAELERDTARAEAAALAADKAALETKVEAALKGVAGKPKPPRKPGAAPGTNRGDRQTDEQKLGTEAAALAIIAEEPGISGSELGRRLGTTPGYGRTLMRKLSPAPAGGGS